ncbi:MAG: YihY/virulence factor BrkB family protein, partial [Opitutaceae bacterium]
ERFIAIDGAQRAAAFAYYAIFSLFPLLVLFVSIGSAFFDRQAVVENVIEYAERYVPLEPSMQQQVFDAIRGVIEARGQVGTVALIVLVWGSLQFFKALVRATNRAWNMDMHNWWQMPLKSVALVGVLGTALLLGIAVPAAAKFVLERLPSMHGVTGWTAKLALATVPMLVLFYGLALFYRMAPRRKPRFSEVWIAAIGAAVALRLVESLFMIYVKNFGRFNAVYGTFGGIMALLTWIYLSGCIVVFGACLSAARENKPSRR